MTTHIQKWTSFRWAAAMRSLQQNALNVGNRQQNRVNLATLAQTNAALASTLGTFVITGIAGQISFVLGTGQTIGIGSLVTIAGTFGGTGSITGYVSPTTYKVLVTNGSTTATLGTVAGGAIVTAAGTPSGITETVFPTMNWAQWRVGFTSRVSTAGLMLNVPAVPGFVPPVGTNDDST